MLPESCEELEKEHQGEETEKIPMTPQQREHKRQKIKELRQLIEHTASPTAKIVLQEMIDEMEEE